MTMVMMMIRAQWATGSRFGLYIVLFPLTRNFTPHCHSHNYKWVQGQTETALQKLELSIHTVWLKKTRL